MDTNSNRNWRHPWISNEKPCYVTRASLLKIVMGLHWRSGVQYIQVTLLPLGVCFVKVSGACYMI